MSGSVSVSYNNPASMGNLAWRSWQESTLGYINSFRSDGVVVRSGRGWMNLGGWPRSLSSCLLPRVRVFGISLSRVFSMYAMKGLILMLMEFDDVVFLN